MANPPLIQVGAIASAHGVRGQVKLRSFTEPPEAIFSCKTISDATGSRSYKIKREGVKDTLFIASIDGVIDRNAAELLKGTKLYAPRATRENKDNSWTYGELTGLEARLKNGAAYGKVIGVYNFGAGDILELELANGKTEMLPLKAAFIGDVRPEDGFLTVFPPEYLEDSGQERESGAEP